MNGIQFIVLQIQRTKTAPSTREELRSLAVEMGRTKSQREIAKELGVSRSTVFNLLREASVSAAELRP